MPRRDLKVLDAADRAADQINQLIDRPSGRRLINPNQPRRSVHSIAANVAEGFGRGTSGDRSRMLRIARGETEETIQHLSANLRATRISAKEYWALRNLLAVIVKMLNELVRGATDSTSRTQASRTEESRTQASRLGPALLGVALLGVALLGIAL